MSRSPDLTEKYSKPKNTESERYPAAGNIAVYLQGVVLTSVSSSGIKNFAYTAAPITVSVTRATNRVVRNDELKYPTSLSKKKI